MSVFSSVIVLCTKLSAATNSIQMSSLRTNWNKTIHFRRWSICQSQLYSVHMIYNWDANVPTLLFVITTLLLMSWTCSASCGSTGDCWTGPATKRRLLRREHHFRSTASPIPDKNVLELFGRFTTVCTVYYSALKYFFIWDVIFEYRNWSNSNYPIRNREALIHI